jgi:thiol:disulfide interchange protein DsbC
MKTKHLVALILLALGALGFHFASAGTGTDDTVRNAMKKVLPDVTVDEITPAPMAGISEVLIGTKLFYVTNDGKYIFDGTLIELATRTDLSEQRLTSVRHALMDKVSEKDMIIFPASKPRHTLTVFTDIDCGYCRKLHNEIKKYNAEGITIRYMLFPRSGPDTPSYYKAVSVWCAADRKAAMTAAKAGRKVVEKTCDNPVDTHMSLAAKFNITGTPTLVLEDGSVIPGYIGAQQLARLLDDREPTAK